MAFYIDGTERTGRTKIFACSTSDASLDIHHREFRRIRIVRIFRHHQDGPGRTMTRTVTTRNSVALHHTKLFYKYRMTYLSRNLVGQRLQINGIRRAYLSAALAFRTAIAALVRHFRLHKPCQVSRRPQHAIRTCRHTQLARRAVLGKMTLVFCTRRQYRRHPLRLLLVYNRRKAAVNLFLLRTQYRTCRHHCRYSQKRAARSTGLCLRLGGGNCG